MEKTKKSGVRYNAPIVKSWTNEGHFIIPDVTYRNKTGTYRLFDQMTPAMNQEQLAEFYEQEKAKGNPHPTDAPLIWAICTRAYTLKNENSEASKKLKVFLKNSFRECPNTLTRIIYAPSGEDRIIHNYKTSDEYSIDARVVGPDGWMTRIPDKEVLEQLLGTKDITKINEVSQWINNTGMYLFRLNSNPKTRDERVARFYANGGLDLGCDRGPRGEVPAFRVLKVD